MHHWMHTQLSDLIDNQIINIYWGSYRVEYRFISGNMVIIIKIVNDVLVDMFYVN